MSVFFVVYVSGSKRGAEPSTGEKLSTAVAPQVVVYAPISPVSSATPRSP